MTDDERLQVAPESAMNAPIDEWEGHALGARKAAVEAGKALAEDAGIPTVQLQLHEDELLVDPLHYDLRLRFPSRTIPAGVLRALGERGWSLEFLGVDDESGRQDRWVYMIETGGDVHGRVH